MDIQMNTGTFKQFLVRCAWSGAIRDLAIHTAQNNTIKARFCDKLVTTYGEVYQEGVKISEEGNIRIPNLQKLIAVINRTESDIIRIKSTADAFLITEGSGVGKLQANMAQSSDAEIVESYQSIEHNLNAFNKDILTYNNDNVKFENGVSIDVGALTQLLDDSKAFGYETFKIVSSKGLLKCKIENNQNGENFNRTIADKDFIGSVENIPVTIVGLGFKEMVKALKDSNSKEKVKMFFHETAWLLTNSKDFFYVINTLEVD